MKFDRSKLNSATEIRIAIDYEGDGIDDEVIVISRDRIVGILFKLFFKWLLKRV